MKKTVLHVGKYAISILLMAVLLYKAELKKIWLEISRTDPYFLTLALGLFLLLTVVLAFRWKILTTIYSNEISIWYYFKYFLYSYFFNNFLPTSIGGDIIRALKLHEHLGDRPRAFASVIIDRLTGIFASLTFILGGVFFSVVHFRGRMVIFSIIGFTFLMALFLFVLFNSRIFRKYEKLLSRITAFQIGDRINRFILSVHEYKSRKIFLFWGYILSMIAQAMMVLVNYFIAVGLGYHPSLGYMFFAIPLSFIVTLFPSINGVGVRDWSYVVLFRKVGIPMAGAVSMSVLVLGIQVLVSLWGGILWIFEKRHFKMKTLEEAAEEMV